MHKPSYKKKVVLSTIVAPSFIDFSVDDNSRLANMCGALHENIHLIEQHFKTKILIKDASLRILDTTQSPLLHQLLHELYTQSTQAVSKNTVQNLLTSKYIGKNTMSHSIHLNRKTITPRNTAQTHYLQAIDTHDMTFGTGPAGTGKTWLAVGKALEYFQKGYVQRLIFTRPAVEAGEKLGFLPGDLVDKVLPYLRPIYDALYEMLGFKETQKLIQSDTIEILPLAFMRGRTLNEAFIILDEAQNATTAQMKMFLTRLGFGSKAVITGDTTQTDLPKGTRSGLLQAIAILNKVDGVAIHAFHRQDVVRHPLVSRIVERYDALDAGKNHDV